MAGQRPRPSAMTRDDFVAAFGSVFEHSPWIAEGAFDAGLGPDADTAAGLHDRLCAVFRAAPPQRRRDVLLAHPDLAGRLAVTGALTPDSTAEQASAGLDRCTPAEFERLQALNAIYREKFGFPFIMAVKGRSKAEIIAAFERRIESDAETEFATALGEVERIARLRLEALMGG